MVHESHTALIIIALSARSVSFEGEPLRPVQSINGWKLHVGKIPVSGNVTTQGIDSQPQMLCVAHCLVDIRFTSTPSLTNFYFSACSLASWFMLPRWLSK